MTRAGIDPKTLGMVIPRWVAKLDEVLQRLGLPVRAVFVAAGTLHVWLTENESEPFSIQVRPRTPDGQAWAKTARFEIAYAGAHDPDPTRQRWLSLVLGIVRKLEDRFPASFEMAGGVFHDHLSAEARFLLLFPFCNVERSHVGDQQIVEVLVRTMSRCNQRCPFCSAPDVAALSHATVEQSIRGAAEAFPGAMLSLTGGEPTLRPSFSDELELALALEELGEVHVQTNAVAFGSRLDPARFPSSTRLCFFVSLHGIHEAIYDRCTGTSGQLPLALSGIERILRAKHRTILNCVVNAANIDHLDTYVRGLPALIPMQERVELHFSTLICAERSERAADFLVPYTKAARALESAFQTGVSLGVPIQSLRSSTHASIPPCMLNPSQRNRDPHRYRPPLSETGFEDMTKPWVKARTCSRCSESDYCLGVPRPYALKFGLSELEPLEGA